MDATVAIIIEAFTKVTEQQKAVLQQNADLTNHSMIMLAAANDRVDRLVDRLQETNALILSMIVPAQISVPRPTNRQRSKPAEGPAPFVAPPSDADANRTISPLDM